MLTVQMLVKDDQRTVRQAVESVAWVKDKTHPIRILVGDLGSNDETPDICKSLGAEVVRMVGVPRHEARNRLLAMAEPGRHFWLHPWEAVVQGHASLQTT